MIKNVKIICSVLLGMTLWTLGVVAVLRNFNYSVIALVVYCLCVNGILDFLVKKVRLWKIAKNTEQQVPPDNPTDCG